MNIEGKIVIEGDKHEVEYEPSGTTGLSTLYLRVKGVPHNTPIYIDQIGDVIEMLERGRRAIQALEGSTSKAIPATNAGGERLWN